MVVIYFFLMFLLLILSKLFFYFFFFFPLSLRSVNTRQGSIAQNKPVPSALYIFEVSTNILRYVFWQRGVLRYQGELCISNYFFFESRGWLIYHTQQNAEYERFSSSSSLRTLTESSNYYY